MIKGVEVIVGEGEGVFEGRGGCVETGVSAMGRDSIEGVVGAETDSLAQALCEIIRTNGKAIFNPHLINKEIRLLTNR